MNAEKYAREIIETPSRWGAWPIHPELTVAEEMLRLIAERDALKVENEQLRGALADIAYSRDMTLFLARKKAQRIYCLTFEERDD